MYATALAFCGAVLLPAQTQTAPTNVVDYKLDTPHFAQEEDWSCGVNVIRMWSQYATGQPVSFDEVTAIYTAENGTTLPEMCRALRLLAHLRVAEVAYADEHEAVKGVAYAIAKWHQPVAIAGKTYHGGIKRALFERFYRGKHYYLARGYKGSSRSRQSIDAALGYPEFQIEGVYLEDSTFESHYYAHYAQYAIDRERLVTSAGLTTKYWLPIGKSNPWSKQNRWRALESHGNDCPMEVDDPVCPLEENENKRVSY